MNKKKIIIFAVCLAGLLAIQIKFFLPFMYDIAASDLFWWKAKTPPIRCRSAPT